MFPVGNRWGLGSLIVLVACLVQIWVGTAIHLRDYRALHDGLETFQVFIKTLSAGKLSVRLKNGDDPGLRGVGDALNELADKLEGQVHSLQRLVDENAAISGKIKSEAVTEERQRLARDLHDAVSQQLFALSMLASAAKRSIGSNPEQAAEHITDVADIARKAQGEMRALLLHLRPVRLNDDSLDRGLQRLVEELAGKTPIQFEADIRAVAGLSRGVENHLFRLSQEALSNALRHSQATLVKLTLFGDKQSVTLSIYDNGCGFDPAVDKIASYGLKTMRERAEEIGAHFLLTTHVNQGTSIRIRVPIEERGSSS
ncbi:MAG: sensor histidine kinase [Sporolactobacillus sp.]